MAVGLGQGMELDRFEDHRMVCRRLLQQMPPEGPLVAGGGDFVVDKFGGGHIWSFFLRIVRKNLEGFL